MFLVLESVDELKQYLDDGWRLAFRDHKVAGRTYPQFYLWKKEGGKKHHVYVSARLNDEIQKLIDSGELRIGGRSRGQEGNRKDSGAKVPANEVENGVEVPTDDARLIDQLARESLSAKKPIRKTMIEHLSWHHRIALKLGEYVKNRLLEAGLVELGEEEQGDPERALGRFREAFDTLLEARDAAQTIRKLHIEKEGYKIELDLKRRELERAMRALSHAITFLRLSFSLLPKKEAEKLLTVATLSHMDVGAGGDAGGARKEVVRAGGA